MVRTKLFSISIAVAALCASMSCANGIPLGPTGAGSQTSSSSGGSNPAPAPAPTPAPAPAPPTGTATTGVAYTPDLKPILDADCTACHGTRSAAGRYSTATYAGVMAAVRAGSALSPLVIVTKPGGAMYGFLSGDRAAKSALIAQWVLSGAPANR